MPLSSYRIAAIHPSYLKLFTCFVCSAPPLRACKSNDVPRQRKMLENCLANAANVQCFKLKVSPCPIPIPAPSSPTALHHLPLKVKFHFTVVFPFLSLYFSVSLSLSLVHPLGLSDLHCI